MTASWFLLAVRPPGPASRGLFDDAAALAHNAACVEILVAGDALSELLAVAAAPNTPTIRVVVDGHSWRRRGSPPLHPEWQLVESDHVAHRLLDPEWKVVWR
jgi:hypothetical protein